MIKLSRLLQKAYNEKFSKYRKTIYQKFGIDIKDFSMQQHESGLAKNMKIWQITKFSLKQILMGIKVELQHTNDKQQALKITLDHLTQQPHYYTHLELFLAYWDKIHLII